MMKSPRTPEVRKKERKKEKIQKKNFFVNNMMNALLAIGCMMMAMILMKLIMFPTFPHEYE